MSKIKKRFIAGAVCPRCSEMDKIFTYQEDNKSMRACVSCDFVDEMRIQSTPSELETRVNKKEVEEQVVKIQLTPPKS